MDTALKRQRNFLVSHKVILNQNTDLAKSGGEGCCSCLWPVWMSRMNTFYQSLAARAIRIKPIVIQVENRICGNKRPWEVRETFGHQTWGASEPWTTPPPASFLSSFLSFHFLSCCKTGMQTNLSFHCLASLCKDFHPAPPSAHYLNEGEKFLPSLTHADGGARGTASEWRVSTSVIFWPLKARTDIHSVLISRGPLIDFFPPQSIRQRNRTAAVLLPTRY